MQKYNLGPVTAYAIAKKNGFTGTEAEWLESLKGETGAGVPPVTESDEGKTLNVVDGVPVWKEPAAKTVLIKENTKGEVHIWDYDSGIYNFVNEQMYYNFVAIMKINGDGDGVVGLSTLYSGDAIQISIIRTVTKKKVMWIGTVLENGDMFRITHDTVNNVWETTKESLGTSFLRVPTVPGTEGQVLTAGASGLPQWSDPPESGVQPDWNQNDSTAPDYVKNRTHYSAHFEKVYPDEDIQDRYLYDIYYPSHTYFYVGSEVLSSDEIMGAEVYGRTGMSTYTTATINSSSPGTGFDLNGEHSTLYFNSEHREGTEILVVHEEFEYDGKTVKTGIYFREAYQAQLIQPIRLSVSHDSIKKLDEKFIPDSVARKTDVWADWDETDETAQGYVKNRPFYEEFTEQFIVPEQTVTAITLPEVQGGAAYGLLTFSDGVSNFIEGNTYKVVYDGESYECVAAAISDEPVVTVGNLSILGAFDNSGEPFLMFYIDGQPAFYCSTEGGHTVSVKGLVATVHKIDDKYLPAQPVRVVTIYYDDANGEYVCNMSAEEIRKLEPDDCAIVAKFTADDGKVYTASYAANESWLVRFVAFDAQNADELRVYIIDVSYYGVSVSKRYLGYMEM